MMTSSQLGAFTRRVAEAFNAGRIRAPVHLSGGNENRLIDIFKDINPGDWVLTGWRSHYHCLLKGVSEEQLFADILAGKSITLCYPEHRILSSAIVGGIAPLAIGIALGIKRAGGGDRVYCFLGDMAAMTGTVAECRRYAYGHDLPVCWIVEDNGKSVCTSTERAWGSILGPFSEVPMGKGDQHYSYVHPWPHAGAGKRIQF